jgi:hypothetical protein
MNVDINIYPGIAKRMYLEKSIWNGGNDLDTKVERRNESVAWLTPKRSGYGQAC